MMEAGGYSTLEANKAREIGEEPSRFLALNFSPLRRRAVKNLRRPASLVTDRLKDLELTVIQFYRLVGSRSCLILRSVLAQPKVQIV